MSTIKQIQANRLNATKSTGPRTEAGKSVTRLNALKHGLFATDPIIPGENPAHFEALHASHYLRWQPATVEEQILVASMVRDAWSLERSSNAETSMWTHAMQTLNKGDTNPLGRSQIDLAEPLALVQRRIDSAQRNYRRNLELLIKLQAAREKLGRDVPGKLGRAASGATSATETTPEPIAQSKSPEPLNPQIGSVPLGPDTPGRSHLADPLLWPKPLSETPPEAA
jgi:hypothetical protein